MAEFFREDRIKCTRKVYTCESCGKKIALGSECFSAATKADGDFFAFRSHVECRTAEIAWNSKADYWGDEYCWLYMIREDEDADEWATWLRENHPIAAERVLP